MRKRYISKTVTPTQSLMFYTKGSELTIEHTVKEDNEQEGCNYYFSSNSTKDWFDATQLHLAILNHINKENNRNE